MHILLVDDSDVFLAFMSKLLESFGASVTCASDGAAALAAFDAARPDLVFSDIQMPGMDGFAVLAAIRERTGAAVPVIAVTSSWGDDALHDYVGSGFDWAIQKPISTAAVFAVLRAQSFAGGQDVEIVATH